MDIQRLKCTRCKNFLSYFPIYFHQDHEKTENICGRCWTTPAHRLIPGENYIRNEAYETVACFLKFPCRYQKEGCLETLPPRAIPKHEDNCFYKIVECPLNDFVSCRWRGSRSDIFQHCDNHKDLFLRNCSFNMGLSKSHECINLLKWEHLIFLLTRKFESVNNMLQLSVCHLRDVVDLKECSFHVYFKTTNRSLCIKGITSSFQEMKNKSKDIFLDSLRNLHNESPTVTVKFNFIKSEEVSSNSAHKEALNEDLLSQLKCSICQHYAIPPIYEYGEGQIKCSECRDKEAVSKSPISNPNTNTYHAYGYLHYDTPHGRKATVSAPEIRNFNLDKLANLLNYPCRYRSSGCKFVSKPEEMKNHQTSCFHKVHECPINEYTKCEWKGTGKEMATHIYGHHNDMISQTSQISECTVGTSANRLSHWELGFSPNNGSEKCYILKFSNRLYRLSFVIKGQLYSWELQAIDHLEGNFTYDIEVVNNNDQQQRLVARQTGSTLTRKDELFKNKNRCCILHAPEVEHFLTPQKKITFKLNVTK